MPTMYVHTICPFALPRFRAFPTAPRLTSTVQIFAVNTVLPMLNYVYWNNAPTANNTVLINLSLLAGTLIGQLIFGVLGDRYGRRKLYGWELLILTVATLFMTIASRGALQNTSRVAWIAAWRFLMGIGIGGDYPLSAVITAE
jgi:MFS transporter, PHS family, inorganic phosphate transporter